MAATQGLPVTAKGDVERVARGVPALDFGDFPGMHSFSQHEDAYGRGRWCHWRSTWERDIPMGAVCRSPETGLPNNSPAAPNAYAPGEREELIERLREVVAAQDALSAGELASRMPYKSLQQTVRSSTDKARALLARMSGSAAPEPSPQLRWQDDKPAHPQCCLRKTVCGGNWVEMRGVGERVGWHWSCADGDCPHAIRAWGG